MAHVRQSFLILVAFVLPALVSGAATTPIYFPDDPIQRMPAPHPVVKPFVHKIDQLYDFVLNSVRWNSRPPNPAGAINTVGEVPDSAWFTNRHASHRMTREELQKGPVQHDPPAPPFTIVGGKPEGITPGFRMEDSKKRLYFVKTDPLTNPELGTSSDVIVSRFLYDIGYNVPENVIVIAKASDFKISEKAEVAGENGARRKMTRKDFEDIVKKIPHYNDGSFRMMASLKIEGEPIGPFYYEEMREDDPNDMVLHENRRDLRGLHTIFAWLNNTDARAGNTYDVMVQDNGVAFIKHYLVDFGSALGSDGDSPKDARLGHEFMIATPHEALGSIATLGLVPRRWEHINYPHDRAVGHFTAEDFDPDTWKSDYPNAAFLSRLPDDDYWAAKQIMAFTDEEIRAIVETGRFSNPYAVDYLTATLVKRRDKIGQTSFSKVLPLDNFSVKNGELQFDDLAVVYKLRAAQNYEIHWFEFDNMTGHRTRMDAPASPRLPDAAMQSAVGSYFSAVLSSATDDRLNPVIVTLVKTNDGFRVVGVSRYFVRSV